MLKYHACCWLLSFQSDFFRAASVQVFTHLSAPLRGLLLVLAAWPGKRNGFPGFWRKTVCLGAILENVEMNGFVSSPYSWSNVLLSLHISWAYPHCLPFIMVGTVGIKFLVKMCKLDLLGRFETVPRTAMVKVTVGKAEDPWCEIELTEEDVEARKKPKELVPFLVGSCWFSPTNRADEDLFLWRFFGGGTY